MSPLTHAALLAVASAFFFNLETVVVKAQCRVAVYLELFDRGTFSTTVEWYVMPDVVTHRPE